MKNLQKTFLGLFIFSNLTFGQVIKESSVTVKNERCTYSYIEPSQEIKGILILLPGWGESPKSIFEKTKLPHILLNQGFITIVPQLHQTLFADDYTISEINEILNIKLQQYGSNKLNIIIGGFSAGGAIAIGYTEYLLQINTALKPKGVFAIDPPLDLDRMFTSAENKIRYNCKNKLINKEGSFIRNYLLNTLKGSPQEKAEEYLKFSAYSANEHDGGKAKILKDIPVRLYSEPDLDFVRKKYCNELQFNDINAIDLEKLERFLKGNGNSKVEYITTKNKGFHSWNILEPMDCVNWILRITTTL